MAESDNFKPIGEIVAEGGRRYANGSVVVGFAWPAVPDVGAMDRKEVCLAQAPSAARRRKPIQQIGDYWADEEISSLERVIA
jgi:hypothetical protein